MPLIIYSFVFIYGAVIGSFLNVVIYRVPNNMSLIKPASHCPYCKTKLKPIDLIPLVSFLMLGCECRYCKKKISIRYFLIELLSAVLTLLVFVKFEITIETIYYAMFIYIMICVAMIDFDHMIIPNGLLITGCVLFIGYFSYNYLIDEIFIFNNLIAALIGMGFMLVIYLLGYIFYKQEALGMGDVKLFFVIGLFLSIKGTIMTFIFAILLGGIAGVILLTVKKKGRRTEMPFGPYIALGAVLALFVGENIYQWYIGFLI